MMCNISLFHYGVNLPASDWLIFVIQIKRVDQNDEWQSTHQN